VICHIPIRIASLARCFHACAASATMLSADSLGGATTAARASKAGHGGELALASSHYDLAAVARGAKNKWPGGASRMPSASLADQSQDADKLGRVSGAASRRQP